MTVRKKKAAILPPHQEKQLQVNESPLVFISHDSRDADLAEAFANLLTDASGGILKSFRSSDRKGTAGIEYGQEWYQAIMTKLDAATDVVALLTSKSIDRPWILYETGVAKGKLSANDRVFGIALGVTLNEAATGPFAQFQNSPDEEDAITGLVLQLIRRNPQASPREEAVRRQVKAFRESVSVLLKKRKEEVVKSSERPDENSVAKFFEEIKVMVGGVPERVAGQLGSDFNQRLGKRRKRFRPSFYDSLLQPSMFRENQGSFGLPILIAFSTVREQFPWLYELAMDFYRASCKGDHKAIEMARGVLIDAIEFTTQEPWAFEMISSPEDEDALMFLRHFARDIAREFAIKPRRISKWTVSDKSASTPAPEKP